MSDNSINNTYQIEEEFKCKELKKSFYRAPKVQCMTAEADRRGKVRVFSEEEVFLYALKAFDGRGYEE